MYRMQDRRVSLAQTVQYMSFPGEKSEKKEREMWDLGSVFELNYAAVHRACKSEPAMLGAPLAVIDENEPLEHSPVRSVSEFGECDV